MADVFKGIITADGKKRQLPYGAVLKTPISDETLSIQGGFADAKVVGDKFKEAKAETDSLKEDLSNKITKFYTSNQGETNITDSDNGKIQDMMLYGKSSQDGTPTPENPVEIKSVMNPTVKVCGKNFYPGSDLIGLTKAYVTDFMPVILHKGKICISFDAFSDTSDGKYLVSVQYFDANKENIGGNGDANIVGNNISHAKVEFNGANAGKNHETINLQNVLYVKIMFYIYKATATEITYKNIMISATDSDFEPYKPIQTVTLPYSLNAIPVNSGGNVTINGQQYVADYVDEERGKLVRMCKEVEYNGDESWELQSVNANNIANFRLSGVMALESKGLSNKLLLQNTLIANTDSEGFFINNIFQLYIRISKNRNISTVAEFKNFLSKNPIRILLASATPEEIDLTPEEIAAFKALATYYPVTNISVNSEQLDGYTVFNYPISMENGWNYVKQQLNDNRDYIYDMDTQSAEAYVNSEYAVALTELEV